jgi:peptidoglycan-associated lipoprotein
MASEVFSLEVKTIQEAFMRLILATCAALFVLAGCAHAKPAEPVAPKAEPVVQAPPPKVEAPAPAPAPERDDVSDLLKGLAIHFDFDRADLTADSQKRLDTLADALRSHPAVHIKVAGNCDELGTEEYNLALGQRRADAVKTYLSHLGIQGGRIETVTFGKEKPLDPAHTPDAWSANRRDDFERQN